MTRNNNQSSSNKRKEPSSSSHHDSEPKRKIKKNSDDVECSSYPSTVFTLDVLQLLKTVVVTTEHDLLFNNRPARDNIIMKILKEYQLLFIKNNNNNIADGCIQPEKEQFGTRITTHGKMHIDNSIQSRRNQCRIVAEDTTIEMYLCVHSSEFNPSYPLPSGSSEDVFVFDEWLVYRCEPMRTPSLDVFQTKSTMIGNRTNIKSFHWLAFHRTGYCSIRTLDQQVDEVRVVDTKASGAVKDKVPISIIKEQLKLSSQSTLLSIIPINSEITAISPWICINGQFVCPYQQFNDTTTSTTVLEAANSGNQQMVQNDEALTISETLPVQSVVQLEPSTDENNEKKTGNECDSLKEYNQLITTHDDSISTPNKMIQHMTDEDFDSWFQSI